MVFTVISDTILSYICITEKCGVVYDIGSRNLYLDDGVRRSSSRMERKVEPSMDGGGE